LELDYTPTIRQHYVFLVDNLDAKHSGLVGELYSAGVIGRQEIEAINSEMMSFIQNEKLLSMLRCKSKDQFDKFLDALDKTGQQYVRNHITGRQGQLVTSAKEVMVLPDLFVCLLVCLCVSKITQKVMDRSF